MEPQQCWSAKTPMFSKAIFISVLSLHLVLHGFNTFLDCFLGAWRLSIELSGATGMDSNSHEFTHTHTSDQ